MKVLVYDCEIVRCIPNRQGDCWPTSARTVKRERIELEYCSGWSDYEHMGISLIGCWASWLPYIKVFTQPAFDRFQKLVNQADLIVGFNSMRFDDRLCRANGLEIATDYDLLPEVWAAAGMPREYTYGITRAGYNLNALAVANLGYGKSGKGELAPSLWQRGYRWSVVDYLVDDILITKKIWDRRSNLIDPTDRLTFLHLRSPEAEEGTESYTRISLPSTPSELSDEIPF
jgi:DEAD/DEAH box helicase domain-containing protein